MDSAFNLISSHSYTIASSFPEETLIELINILKAINTTDKNIIKTKIMREIHTPSGRELISNFLDDWSRGFPDITPFTIAIALSTALYSDKKHRESSTVEPVWSGPRNNSIPLRRTEQALIELINSAKEELLIVSFAVYSIDSIIHAVTEACNRKVAVNIILETPVSGAEKINYNTIESFGKELKERTKIYIWPVERRKRDQEGKIGTLHAKCAIADRTSLLISSANLTYPAFDLNIELGILIKKGPLPVRIAEQFDILIQEGIFRLYKS